MDCGEKNLSLGNALSNGSNDQSRVNIDETFTSTLPQPIPESSALLIFRRQR